MYYICTIWKISFRFSKDKRVWILSDFYLWRFFFLDMLDDFAWFATHNCTMIRSSWIKEDSSLKVIFFCSVSALRKSRFIYRVWIDFHVLTWQKRWLWKLAILYAVRLLMCHSKTTFLVFWSFLTIHPLNLTLTF